MKNYNGEFNPNGHDADDEILEGEIADAGDTDFDDLDYTEFDDAGLDEFDDLDDLPEGADDDRINRVLDELAELRRSMSPSERRQAGAPSYDSYRGGNTPGEVALYNEISRLRDELAKLQHSQSMHYELNRMKEELEKENKQNEDKLRSEIRNMRGADKAVYAEPAQAEPKPAAAADGVDALVKANESLAECVKSLGDKLDADMTDLRRIVADAAVRRETGDGAKERPCAREAHKCRGRRKPPVAADGTEIMRRLVEIKLTLGKLPLADYERELKVLGLYDSLTAAKSAVYSSVSGMAEKLDALRKLESEIIASEDCYIADVVEKYNELIDYVLAQPLSIDGVDVFSKLPASDKIKSTLKGETLSLAVDFVNAVSSARDKKANGAIDKLPEIVGFKNKLQGGRFESENDALYDEIIRLSSDLVFITDPAAAERCADEMLAKIDRICYLPYSEFVSYPRAEYDKHCLIAPRSAVKSFIDDVVTTSECKTDEDSVNALTSAVNLLRSEIANGALAGSVDSGDIRKIIESQKELIDSVRAARDDREKLLADVEDIKSSISTLLGEDVDSLSETENEDISKLLEEVKSLHSEVNTLSGSPETPAASTPDELNLFLSEIVSLRDEVASYKDEVTAALDKMVAGAPASADGAAAEEGDKSGVIMDELTGLRADLAAQTDELTALKGTIDELRGGEPLLTVVDDGASADGSPLMTELAEIKKIVSETPAAADEDKLLAVRDELLGAVKNISVASAAGDVAGLESIKSTLSGIEQQLSDLQLYHSVGTDNGGANISDVLEEIASLRDMLAEGAPAAPASAAPAVSAAPSGDIEALKSEISQLRAELAELKAAKADSDARSEAVLADVSENVHRMVDEPDYSVMNEILALREEFQAMKDRMDKTISLVERPAPDDVLTEIRTLRDQIFAINMASVSDGEQQTYESYNNIIVDELNTVKDELSSLLSIGTDGITVDTSPITDKLEEVKALMNEARDAADASRRAAESDEIVQLKKTIAEQKETQSAMLELMNKMVEKLDAQQARTEKMSDEIASRLSGDAQKDSEAQAAVMNEIENIKYTLGVMQGNDDADADADLEESIGKLKAELSQMAGIMDETSRKGTAKRGKTDKTEK